MMAIGNKIKPLDMEYTFIIMALNIKENGLMIINTVKVFKHGLMVAVMKETINRVKNMDKESIHGKMVAIIMEIGSTIK